MNHHAMNDMFGCRFFMNERIESYAWLFNTFFKTVGCKHSVTVMTDQAFSMVVVIKMVFLLARHRLCCSHIIEKLRKHIGSLRTN